MWREWLTGLAIYFRELQPVCSEILQGIVKIGAVDADEHKSLGGQYGVRGFPTIKIFGANKNKPEEYQGTVKKTTLKQKLSMLNRIVSMLKVPVRFYIRVFWSLRVFNLQVDAVARPLSTEPWTLCAIWWKTGWAANLAALAALASRYIQ